MRKPSSRILRNRVDVYRAVRTQDANGGVKTSYPTALASGVPCSIQPDLPIRELDDDAVRMIERTYWNVMFRDNYALAADDKIEWLDDASVPHKLFVRGLADQAGRGGAYVVSCEERT